MSEVVADHHGEAVVLYSDLRNAGFVAEELGAFELVHAADVIAYAQIDAFHGESDARPDPEIQPVEHSPVAEQLLFPEVVELHAAPQPHAAVNAGERLYRKEVPDVEMAVDEQGHLQVERPRGRPVDFAVLRKGDFAAAAREIDPRFEVERQFPGQ